MTDNRSVIDQEFPVDHKVFVVAIMRKPDGPEHAFLMVEGRQLDGRTILRRYDLFIDLESTKRKSKIVISEKIVKTNEAKETLGNMLRFDRVYYRAWNISKTKADDLHTAIVNNQLEPPDYQKLGDRATGPKSFSVEGHSCFSWAKEKLHSLDDKRIKLNSYTDFVGASARLCIRGKNDLPWSNIILGVFLVILALLGYAIFHVLKT